MNNSFLTAAASYYGLSLDQVQQSSEIDTSTGEFIAVMRILMTPDDLIGVAQRMKTMLEEQSQRDQPQRIAFANEDIRKHYDKMTLEERSKYGSFGCFKHAVLQGVTTVADGSPKPKGPSEYHTIHYGGLSATGSTPVTSNADDFGGLPG